MTRLEAKVLDTNLFLHNPDAVDKAFIPTKKDEIHHGIIPLEVIQELEHFKNEDSERGYHARETARRIEQQITRTGKTLAEGIPITDNYILYSSLPFIKGKRPKMIESLEGLDPNKPDNRIISVGLLLRDSFSEYQGNVELISIDRIILCAASSLGLKANKWRDLDKGLEDLDKCYKGWRIVNGANDMITELKSSENHGTLSPKSIDGTLSPNEYVILVNSGEDQSGKHGISMLGKSINVMRYDAKTDRLVLPQNYLNNRLQKIRPLNLWQMMYLDALYNPDIVSVFGIGAFGTSKTFASVLAGMNQSVAKFDNLGDKSNLQYTRMFITRPKMQEEGEKDSGFLPGDIEQKNLPWFMAIYDQLYKMASYYDNLSEEAISHIMGEAGGLGDLDKYRIYMLDSLYARGRSISDSYWMIDEVENFTRNQVYKLLSRVAENSKVALNGDPFQSAIKGESAIANSLVWANEKFKSSDMSATIWFPPTEIVRGKFANEVYARLNDNI
jgi:PhoH-like ATPase